jgi:hypothetical protein
MLSSNVRPDQFLKRQINMLRKTPEIWKYSVQ